MLQHISNYGSAMDLIFTIYRNNDLSDDHMLTFSLNKYDLSEEEINEFYEEYDQLCEIYDDIQDYFMLNKTNNMVTVHSDLNCYITKFHDHEDFTAGEVKFSKILSKSLWRSDFNPDYYYDGLYSKDGKVLIDIIHWGKSETYWHEDEHEMSSIAKGNHLLLPLDDIASNNYQHLVKKDELPLWRFLHNFYKEYEEILDWYPDRKYQEDLNKGREI